MFFRSKRCQWLLSTLNYFYFLIHFLSFKNLGTYSWSNIQLAIKPRLYLMDLYQILIPSPTHFILRLAINSCINSWWCITFNNPKRKALNDYWMVCYWCIVYCMPTQINHFCIHLQTFIRILPSLFIFNGKEYIPW